MSEPTAADDKPRTVSLEPGENYAWCACGRSSNQPFCDGAHRGTPLRPKVFRVERAEEVHLCMCKRTKNPPYCDGSHRNLAGATAGSGD